MWYCGLVINAAALYTVTRIWGYAPCVGSLFMKDKDTSETDIVTVFYASGSTISDFIWKGRTPLRRPLQMRLWILGPSLPMGGGK